MKVANYSFWRKYDEDIDLWQWFPDIQIPIPKAFFHFSYFVIFRAYSHTDKRCITFSYLLKKWKNSIWLESTILFYRFLFCFPQLSQRDNSPKPINLFQWFARLYDISFFHFILLVAEVFLCTNRHLFVTCLTLWARVICRKSS